MSARQPLLLFSNSSNSRNMLVLTKLVKKVILKCFLIKNVMLFICSFRNMCVFSILHTGSRSIHKWLDICQTVKLLLYNSNYKQPVVQIVFCVIKAKTVFTGDLPTFNDVYAHSHLWNHWSAFTKCKVRVSEMQWSEPVFLNKKHLLLLTVGC